jgi:hypothetical protein
MPADLLDPEGWQRFGVSPEAWANAMDQQNAIIARLSPAARAHVEALIRRHRREHLQVLRGEPQAQEVSPGLRPESRLRADVAWMARRSLALAWGPSSTIRSMEASPEGRETQLEELLVLTRQALRELEARFKDSAPRDPGTVPLYETAEAVGIQRSTASSWLRDGELGEAKRYPGDSRVYVQSTAFLARRILRDVEAKFKASGPRDPGMLPLYEASEAIGIERSTAWRWLAAGELGEAKRYQGDRRIYVHGTALLRAMLAPKRRRPAPKRRREEQEGEPDE